MGEDTNSLGLDCQVKILKNSEIDRDYEIGIFSESNDSHKGRYLDFEIRGIFIILKNVREFLLRKKNG